ncbi:hypothetical protein GLYMA_02G212900v4 [Glycine max]|uniref:Uncharacterized protein n=1 Tax=Glycine max TaxID=3847 RepID=A0A0R0KZA1_SOYBN|nr:hypothetical protein GYH30_004765 [Glycine max]KRH72445.1 hypothetical protein GLYMA_02G212900v4 [Glycine max]
MQRIGVWSLTNHVVFDYLFGAGFRLHFQLDQLLGLCRQGWHWSLWVHESMTAEMWSEEEMECRLSAPTGCGGLSMKKVVMCYMRLRSYCHE